MYSVAISNGFHVVPCSAAQRSPNSSKSRFHAAEWIVAVRVITPSRSKSSAGKGPRSASQSVMGGIFPSSLSCTPHVRPGRSPQVIKEDVFAVDPWAVPERELDLELLAQAESIFALSNGHIGLRGNLDEGEPHVIPGTYLNGLFESLPLPYAERGYGYPEEGQSLINVTNGKLFRLLVDDEPFDVRYGTLLRHERVLDLRDGVLRRRVEWASPTGKVVR